MSQESLKIRTVKAIAWKLLERSGNQIILLVVTIVMARLLTPAEYGVLAVITVFINIASIFVQSGLNTALIQNPDTTEDDYSTVYWLSSGVAAVFVVTMIMTAPIVSEFYVMPALCWPMRVLALTLFLNAYNSVQIAKITRDLEMKKMFYATLASVSVSGVLGIVLALMGFGVWALVGQQFVSGFINCIVLAVQVNWKPRIVFDGKRARELFSFGSKLMLSSLCYAIYQNSADLIIGKVFNSEQLGLVSKAKSWPTTLLSALDSTIRSVMLSSASKVQDDLELIKRVASRSIQLISYCVVPLMTCLALVAYPFTIILIGEQWVGSVPFMQMFCLYCALRGLSGANGEVLSALGRSDIYLKSDVIQMILGLALLAAASFVAKDIYMMIVSYIGTRIAVTVYGGYQVQKLTGYTILGQIRDCAPPYVLSLAAALAAYPIAFLNLSLLMLLFAQAATFLLIYIFLSALFKVEGFEYLLTTVKEALEGR